MTIAMGLGALLFIGTVFCLVEAVRAERRYRRETAANDLTFQQRDAILGVIWGLPEPAQSKALQAFDSVEYDEHRRTVLVGLDPLALYPPALTQHLAAKEQVQ